MNGLLAPLLSILACAALFVAFGLARRRASSRSESCSACASACRLKEPPHGHP